MNSFHNQTNEEGKITLDVKSNIDNQCMSKLNQIYMKTSPMRSSKKPLIDTLIDLKYL